MPRDYDLEFDDEDLRPRQSRQPRQYQGERMQGDRMSGGAPVRRTSSKKKKSETRSIIILAVEVVIFILLLVTFFILKSKIVDGSASSDSAAATEASAEEESSGGVNVDSDNFTLTCTKVQLANDADGNPAALIYFTFLNKTDKALSMDEVFPPSVKQNGADCPTNAVLVESPVEVDNAKKQINQGESIECCYAIRLQDFTSTLTLTIHDNYDTFSDIGTTEIPLS